MSERDSNFVRICFNTKEQKREESLGAIMSHSSFGDCSFRRSLHLSKREFLKTMDMCPAELTCLRFIHGCIAMGEQSPARMTSNMGRFMRNPPAFQWFKKNLFHEEHGSFLCRHSKLFGFADGRFFNKFEKVEDYLKVISEEKEAEDSKSASQQIVKSEYYDEPRAEVAVNIEANAKAEVVANIEANVVPGSSKLEALKSSTNNIVQELAKKKYPPIATAKRVDGSVKRQVEKPIQGTKVQDQPLQENREDIVDRRAVVKETKEEQLENPKTKPEEGHESTRKVVTEDKAQFDGYAKMTDEQFKRSAAKVKEYGSRLREGIEPRCKYQGSKIDN